MVEATSNTATAFQDLLIIGSPLVVVPQRTPDFRSHPPNTGRTRSGFGAAADAGVRRRPTQDACEAGRVSGRVRQLGKQTFLGMERNAAFGGVGRTNMRPLGPRAP